MARKTISTLVVKLGSDISEAISGLDAVGVKANKMGRNLQRTGRTLTRNVTLPLAAAGAASFKMASDFDASLSKIEGLVGVQRDQIDAWRGDIRDLSVDYGKSATEAADAMFFITSAGLEGSDALEVLEASLKASASGLGETKTIADLATSAMNAYGSDVLSAAESTDVLTAAVREGKLEPAELASSMGQVLPVASSLGVSFDQVGAAMAAMSRTGTSASEASTQLRSILVGMMKPTAKGEKALSELGLSYAGIRKQIRDQGLLAALADLTAALGDDEEATAAVFGNKRALVGVMDLMGKNAETTAQIFDELAGSTGALDSAFASQQTATLALNQMIAAFKDLLLEIGEAILPMATGAMETIRDVLVGVTDALGRMHPSMQKVVVAVSALAAAIGPAMIALGSMLKVFGFILAPAGAVVTILGTLAFTIGVVAANWDVLKVRTTLVWTAIKSVVFDAISGILEALEKLVGRIPKVGDKVRDLQSDWDSFSEESLAKSGRKLAELEANLASGGSAITDFADEAKEAGKALVGEGGGGGGGGTSGTLNQIMLATAGIERGVVGATQGLVHFKAEAIESKGELGNFATEGEEGMDVLGGKMESLASRGLDAIADFATGSTDALGNFVSFALKELGKLIAKMLVVKGIGAIFGGGAGGFLGGLMGFQAGGGVQAGQAIRVGEFGEEMFVPSTPGRVVSNQDMRSGSGASASEILSVLGPPPAPMTPREASRDRWYREFIKVAVADNAERTGR